MSAKINFASRAVTCKIVFYGPGRSGKTTSLEWVHAQAPAESVGEMVSVATETDRTIFFDYLSLDLGQIAGMTTKFGVYTVPGQVYYNATRKIVLQGADGVAFVADSHPDKRQENIESLDNLKANLKENGLDISDTPLVFEWNKRDLPDAMPVEEMEKDLNPDGRPSFETIATEGKGILKALKTLAGLVIDNLNDDVLGNEEAETAEAETTEAGAAAPEPAEEPEPEPEAEPAQPEPAAAFAPLPAEPEPYEAPEPDPEPEPEPDAVDSEAALAEAFPGVAKHESAPAAPSAPPAPPAKPESRANGRRKKSRSKTAAAARPARRFRWRLVAGALGAAFLVGVQWGSFWPEASGGWSELAAATGGWIWPRYVAMGAALLGVVLLCGVTASGLGRSLPSCFGMGLCCMALLSVVLAGYRANYPAPAPGAETSEPAALRMAEVALVPGLFGRTIRLQKARMEIENRKAAIEDREAELEQLKADQTRAKKELTDARAGMKAELGAVRTLAAGLADQVKAAKGVSDDLRKQLARAKSVTAKERVQAGQLRKMLAAKDVEIRALKKKLTDIETQLREGRVDEVPEAGEPVP